MGETNKRSAREKADTAAANQILWIYTNPFARLAAISNFLWMRQIPIASDGFNTNPNAGSPPHPLSISQTVFPH
jgi:hypothetical protein